MRTSASASSGIDARGAARFRRLPPLAEPKPGKSFSWRAESKLAGARGTDLNGLLDAKELAKLKRFDDRRYGDGVAVTREEFLETREAEMRDNRDARREEFAAGLSTGEAREMQRLAGDDGKLSADEYVEGKKQLWRERHEGRRDQLFEAAGGEKP